MEVADQGLKIEYRVFTFEKGHPWIQGTYIQRFGYNTGPRGLSSELSRVAP